MTEFASTFATRGKVFQFAGGRQTALNASVGVRPLLKQC